MTAAPSPAAAPTAAIEFTEARRPEAAIVVRLETFDGPLALLLSLIEQRQLDVLSVPLGDLASAYLEALAELAGDRLRHISAFVTVASQLILIKSRALLPRPPAPPAVADDDGRDPEAELRERLVLYRAYRAAGGRLAVRLTEGLPAFPREVGPPDPMALVDVPREDLPPVDPLLLPAALARVVTLVVPPGPPPAVVPRTVTLEERAAVIRQALVGAPQFVLQQLLQGVTDRVVVAVTFLALLEMVKRREVSVEQAEPWGPIQCREVTAAEREQREEREQRAEREQRDEREHRDDRQDREDHGRSPAGGPA